MRETITKQQQQQRQYPTLSTSSKYNNVNQIQWIYAKQFNSIYKKLLRFNLIFLYYNNNNNNNTEQRRIHTSHAFHHNIYIYKNGC